MTTKSAFLFFLLLLFLSILSVKTDQTVGEKLHIVPEQKRVLSRLKVLLSKKKQKGTNQITMGKYTLSISKLYFFPAYSVYLFIFKEFFLFI